MNLLAFMIPTSNYCDFDLVCTVCYGLSTFYYSLEKINMFRYFCSVVFYKSDSIVHSIKLSIYFFFSFRYRVSMIAHLCVPKILILFFFSILLCRHIPMLIFLLSHSCCYFLHLQILMSSFSSSSRWTPF